MSSTWILLRRPVASRSIPRLRMVFKSMSTHPGPSQMDHLLYTATVDAEPLHRYRQGGYHPVALGDCLKAGRYKVLHKLGWGGYSTVWAARDQREEVYVAVKISVAEREHEGETRELQTMKELASHLPPPKHTVHLLDDFDLRGPNGSHECLVYELLGPNIPDTIDAHFPAGRLPGQLAKAIAKQALIGLDSLHQQRIGHGDLHTRNLAFTMPSMDSLTEEQFTEMLGNPEIGHVRRTDGKDLEPGIPEYIVRPTSYQTRSWKPTQSIKIIDFGESFLRTVVPQTLHTPLPVRAPEIIFHDRIDYQVDLWSMGCMLFELFVGQPPFDTFFLTPRILVGQMLEIATDDMPKRWQGIWDTMNAEGSELTESTGPNLQGWLEEVYFDCALRPDLTREDIARLGQIIGRLLRFEPSARASAREVLDDPWFNE
ncbi:protein kinase [Aspergillus campestris IBT 28561]|uniref:non-specific serine/threonine protein kinase n=1 Tax=Aspergillus campestris (strain IBT 28561) TaxID=1392248 RepID=A0A2I1D5Y6_ASPC2|nr:protein kinase [Aspergillus campestris IBT 28561]PKY05286.1 protein kinase [Aspergillus campestris IBT 28561]